MDEVRDRPIRSFSGGAGVAVALIGLLVLVGWVFDIASLKSVLPGLVDMKLNTALCFVLAGASLCLLRRPLSTLPSPASGRGVGGEGLRRLAQGLAGVVALVGLLTFMEYAFGWDFGIDQALFREQPGAVGTSHAGRMALSSALNFLLLGLALRLLTGRSRRIQQSAQVLTLAAALPALMSLIGYGVSAFYGVGPYTQMALPAAVAFVALCAGVLFARPDLGWIGVVTANGAGGLMARRLLPFAIGLPVGLGWLVLEVERAGIYDSDLGVALGTTLTIALFSILICWSAVTMNQFEEKRGETEARYRSIFENMVEGFFQTTPEGRILTINPALARMHGYESPDEMTATVTDIQELYVFPEHRKMLKASFEKHDVVQGFETQFYRKDGSVIWGSLHARSVRDAGGALLYYEGTIEDITERRRVETALGHSETRLNLLSMAVEQAGESIMITDPDGTIVYVNPAFERVTGYSREEIVGQNPRILKSGKQDAAFYQAMWATLQKGEVWTGHFVNRRKDGVLYEEESVISPMRDAAGSVTHYIAAKRDVTQEKSLEAQLYQAQKMEAVGTLAGGVAHDFNNILTGIIGYTQLALMEPKGSERWREYIAQVPDQGHQAARLISQLLIFSRKAVAERQPLSLASLVKETAKMLERTMPENIGIRLSVSGEVATVNADLTQMQQVIMNLCVNAGQAMPEGGELTVGLENVSLDEVYCRQYAYARPGDFVCLSVRDTGLGMGPDVQARIFDPFFTTKGVGEGTGLGLATVYGIVKGHEGHVNVYSEVGKGSEFKVYLPATNGGAALADAPEQGRPAGGTETILLVEDDDAVQATGQAMLEQLGYRVVVAQDGEEGLRVYRERQGEIALVLTDMVMPKMGGKELFLAMKQVNPAVKTLLMTGYSLKEELDVLRADGLTGFVQKPFDFHSLGRAVRRGLDDPST